MKKRLLSIMFTVGAFAAVQAQTIVSTTPETQSVVLEEFTGIKCTYCPDGHKRANELKTNNPGKVVLINIHTGSYANPSTNQPDFRTPYGTSIAGQTNLTGYPAGSVNRRVFSNLSQNTTNPGSAMSRSKWVTAAGTVFSTPSPVNIAATANFDLNTNQVTVLVELYYTGSPANATNKLNVALIEDSVLGPQTGAASYYPEMLTATGEYIHNHMLRDLITGQWGESIDVSAGPFISKTYTYDIPADFNGIVPNIENLHVVAFIAEANDEILNGADAEKTYTAPLAVNQLTANELVSMYPNPAHSQVTLSGLITDNSTVFNTISILDITGKVVYSENVTVDSVTLSTENLTNGTYFISINNNGVVNTKKLIVLH